MRAVSIENVPNGALLGKTVYSHDGRPLLRRGVELSAKTIATLARLGYQYIYVLDGLSDDIEAVESLSDQTRVAATSAVRDAFGSAVLKSDSRFARTGIRIEVISDVATSMVDEILTNKDVSIQMVDLKSYDQYTFQHSVNSTVLGVVLGKALKMNYGDLRDLAVGLLLHDLGNVTVPDAILNKPTQLTEEEFKYIYEHPRSGFELLRHSGGISAQSKIVALQHHEKLDGSGYPKGLKGPDIHFNSKIAAIVDCYDALTSDRHHRKRYLPHEALEYILGSGGTHFEYEMVKAFVELVAPYPPGTLMRLSTGDTGVVLKVDMNMSTRPLMRLLVDRNGKKFDRPEELDLRNYPTISIEKVLDT